ncbi:MAG TPA: transposase [Vicinamibacteria bacterium]|nr:transposase [Vicinamibacteria bacterium]
MDGELFGRLYHLAGTVASRAAGRRRTYSDFEVLVTFVLAAVSNRPLSWACRPSNWPLWCRRLVPRVPTASTMSRRTRTRDFRRLLVRLNAALLADLPGSSLKFLDGKALLVGGHSRDRDARRGRAPGGWGTGYKLHAVVNACGAAEAFAVTPLDAGEATVARGLLVPALGDLRGCLLLADANFDSNPLYADVAGAGGRLLAPRRKPGTGLGHGRRQHPDRLRAIEELEKTPCGAKDFARLRLGVEQSFGLMTQLGLGALPPWVRRLKRVRLWVMGRVIVYHAHLLHQDAQRAA